MKTLLLSATALFAVIATKAQSFTENFNSATNGNLTTSCWVITGGTTTAQPGEAIDGTSLYTAPATNGNSKTDLYTPILVIPNSTLTVDFDYRLTQSLSGNATRTIEVGLVNLAGTLVAVNTIVMGAGTNTNIQHYSYTFTSVTPSNYRVVFRLSGANGNGNVRIVLDNINISVASLYNTSGNCEFAPIAAIILPVKMKSFTAQLNNNKVDLKWITSTEINASHFVIERSYDGSNFSDIATVFAFGNTTEEKSYQFTDNNFASDKIVVYYRLRQVDADGKQDYSSTRMIRIGKQNETAVTILTYPNPVTSEIRITIPGNWQGKKATYEVVNVNGQTAARTEVANASQTETLNTSSLVPGFYLLRVTCDNVTAIQKIIKQ
ncbi:MAG TPA: T9SS type A sorting domain-containing protein [Chitinophagaceae bacterium]